MLSGFYLHYQPIFYLHDLSRVLGYEALPRHPAGWSPHDLLREARRVGAIPVWELRVLERAVEEVLLRTSETLFLNLTPEAFTDTAFAVRVRRAVEGKGVSPTRVCVEVSEQSLYTPEEFGRALEEWVGLGFYVALDDFGTKGSNLDIVLSVKLDFVKLDRVLVGGISRDRQKQRLLTGLVEALSGNGVYPILEGVEDEDDMKWLAGKGWDVGVQGFALARPGSLPCRLERS
ncbi:diguanylate phosphodiesterase [Ammonifex degensii KC4]|uniref:Diguanylate phosphodiesterase n=1 Tax=Ammonifex degensii (strain DSM 10501 / KC4) TaxID=429009 RepID=C9RCC0_AMMDK|nr:EAL domain-containing protein [Ammonifex degensii]ACX51897.1 diguanylate phosphodiesterase [Ammonifex degensii KC4]